MSEKIHSRIFEHGNDKESSWPSDFGEGKRGVFHLDSETGKLVEGYSAPESKAINAFTTTEIKPTHSMADGKVYTDTKSLRNSYKAKNNPKGKHYYEVGNESFPEAKKKERPSAENDVREAIRQLKYNEAPLTEYDRHRCEIINRNLRSNCNHDRGRNRK